MPDQLTQHQKQWIESRIKRLDNYILLKVGLFAIGVVYALADFINAGFLLRIVYVIVILCFFFYIYLYFDTKKFLKYVNTLLRSRE